MLVILRIIHDDEGWALGPVASSADLGACPQSFDDDAVGQPDAVLPVW
jgi:hypothetical protein